MDVSNSRTRNYLKQIKSGAFLKLCALVAAFTAMPVMIKYLGAEEYGVWSTMLTLVSWVMLLDIGLGNGLKNKIAESLAVNKHDDAVAYVSTAYVTLGVILLIFILIFLIFSNLISWQSVFNTKSIAEDELYLSVVFLFSFVMVNFWLSLVNQIFHGLQRSSVVVFGQFVSNSVVLIFVFCLNLYFYSSLIYIVVAYGVALTIANILLTFGLYRKHRFLVPKMRKFDSTKQCELLSLGLRFFLIQISVLVIFVTDKMLITQFLGPSEVTSYDAVFKLFSMFSIIHSILLLPLWTAYSDAYAKKDFNWIKFQIVFQLKMVFVFLIAAIILAVLSPYIIEIWLLGEVEPNNDLIWLMVIYIFITTWNNVFAFYQNAIGSVNLQFYLSLFVPVVNLLVSIYLLEQGVGVVGVVVGSLSALLFYSIFGPMQVFNDLRNTRSVT
jgi:O-antigen/teichoic acid export membrane protein